MPMLHIRSVGKLVGEIPVFLILQQKVLLLSTDLRKLEPAMALDQSFDPRGTVMNFSNGGFMFITLHFIV